METYKGRLDSFSQVKRVKNPSLSSSASVRWTHPASFAATPKTLAEAGFYFNPSWAERDNVQCFNCGKELAGWANDDDPFEIHWTKCRSSCEWASVRCGLRYDVDEDGLYVFNDKKRLPTSKTMEKARLGTFKHWPHDATKGHGASSKKMAQAGFVFTPQVADEAEEDTAACFYCGCTLSGWEPEDDPRKEHEKRAFKTDTPCAFFAKSASSSTKPPSSSVPETKSKPKPKPKPKPKQSVKSSRSTKIPDSDAADESEDELELPPIRKGRSASASKTKSTPEPTAEPSKRRVTRGGSRVGSVAEDDSSSGTKPRTTKAKAKGKKKEDIIEELEEDEAVVESTKPKKSKLKKDPVMDPHSAEDTAEETKPKKTNVNSKARKDPKVTAPDSDPVIDVPTIPSKAISRAAEPKQKLVRSKSKSKSKARPLIVESSESEAHAPEAKRTAAKPKAASPRASPKEVSPHPLTYDAQSEPDMTAITEADHPTFGRLQQEAGDSHTEQFQEPLSVTTMEQGDEQSAHKQVMKVVEISTDDEEGPHVPAEPALALEHSESAPMPVDVHQETKHHAMDETADSEPPHEVKAPSTPPPPPVLPIRSPQPFNAGSSRPNSPQPQAFLPPLAILPVSHIVAFEEPEQNMTVEEWIRHEITLQYSQLKGDGERRIEAFRLRADAMRKRIEAL